MEIWDSKQGKFIPRPKEIDDFLKDIDEVCKKHNLSISHEDGHGAFEIEKYDKQNIIWLNNALKRY